MPLTAISAIDPDRVIGIEGTLPWHIPEDLKLFKRLTLGHTIIMGRRTWDSLPIKPLPGRRHIVFSRSLVHPGITVLPEIAKLGEALDDTESFLIGGAALYEALLPFCEFLILTHVHDRYQGDTWFPDYAGAFEPMETLAESKEFHTVRYRNHCHVPLPDNSSSS